MKRTWIVVARDVLLFVPRLLWALVRELRGGGVGVRGCLSRIPSLLFWLLFLTGIALGILNALGVVDLPESEGTTPSYDDPFWPPQPPQPPPPIPTPPMGPLR